MVSAGENHEISTKTVRKYAKDAPIWSPQTWDVVEVSYQIGSFYKLPIPETPFKTFPSSHFLDFEAPKKIPSSGAVASQLWTFRTHFQAPKNIGYPGVVTMQLGNVAMLVICSIE